MRLSGTLSLYMSKQYLQSVALVFLLVIATILIADTVELLRPCLRAQQDRDPRQGPADGVAAHPLHGPEGAALRRARRRHRDIREG